MIRMLRSENLLAVLFASAAFAPAALAQQAPPPAAPPPASEVDQVVVTGTRATGHTELDSDAPISVYNGRDLSQAGTLSLGEALESVSPAINFPHASTSASVANTRIFSMDGLQSDETLVLINGKRYPLSASLIFNNDPGRGSAPYDIGGIPVGAIDHVEILQDGAASQYGSDAIAGVVNIILKKYDAGGSAAAQTGATEVGDGWNYDFTATQGFKLGDDGRLTITGDLRHQDSTNRAGVNSAVGRVTDQIGEPRSLDESFALDAARPITGNWEAYGFAIFSHRDSVSPATYRAATGSTASPLYPIGYLEHTEADTWDGDASVGVRGSIGGGVKLDLGNTFGYSRTDFTALNTANVQLGLASPEQFNSGGEKYLQDVVNLTATRDFPNLMAGGVLAAGAEYRYENYEIIRGEPDSYFGAGAQGFPGLNPRLPVNEDRSAASLFVDGEIKPVAPLSFELSGRYDHYSDFGDAETGKFSARYNVTSWFALRGSASTGFKAPSLQQQYFSSVAAGLSGTTLVDIGTYQVHDPIATALGATPLKPEKSQHYGVGFVLRPMPAFSITADYFWIDINDRIALSDRLTGPLVTQILTNAGVTNVQQAQFFTNAANTATQGYQISADYRGRVSPDLSYAVSVGYVNAVSTLKSLASNNALPSLPLIGAESLALLLSDQPQSKLTSSLTVDHGPFSALLSVDRYGSWVGNPTGVYAQTFTGKTIVDFSLSAQVSSSVALTAGVLNLGDVYPDKLAGPAAGPTLAGGYLYGDESPFGLNGRSYFVRLQARY